MNSILIHVCLWTNAFISECHRKCIWKVTGCSRKLTLVWSKWLRFRLITHRVSQKQGLTLDKTIIWASNLLANEWKWVLCHPFFCCILNVFLANCCGVFLLFTLIAFICLKFLSSRHHSDKCMNLSDSSYVFLRNIISFSLVYQVESGFTGHTGFNLSFKPLVSIHDQLVCAFSLKQEVLRNRTGCPSITSQPEDTDTHRLACGAFKGLCPRWCIQGSSLWICPQTHRGHSARLSWSFCFSHWTL